MLVGLAIRDVVLIDRLELSFPSGLSVLTGETGAGKSILLDALGLALGQRAEAGLIRAGAAQASVSATFELGPDHPAHALLAEQGLDSDATLILRRQLGADGRSRGFVNDQPIGVALLKKLGESLVEIAGQASQHGLIDSATHRDLLDAFGGLQGERAKTVQSWSAWRAAAAARLEAEAQLKQARRDEDFLRHAVGELEALAPEADEERRLAEQRSLMQNREKLVEAVTAADHWLSGEDSAERQLLQAQRKLDRIADKAGDGLTPVREALDRAAEALTEATQALQRFSAELDSDPGKLERIEERLFALRDLARKHNRPVDGLPALLSEMQAQLAQLDDRSGGFAELTRRESEAAQTYRAAAEALSAARRKAAQKFDKAVNRELPPLKLEKAKFRTAIDNLPEGQWGPGGQDRIAFEVATLPGAAPGPLAKIASGGELSRLMLAMKVVLAAADPVPTLIFDEVDAGIGGATAAAVGERLRRLARELQVVVVTHSPQVAALGAHHWRVEKSLGKANKTAVDLLDRAGRREEIARMLSGTKITDEARAQAEKLMAGAA